MMNIMSFLLLCGTALADSMMLSPAELEAIGMTEQEAKPPNETSLSETAKQKLRLDGIVYHNDDNWYIWLNGQRFSQNQHPARYKIIKVRHDCVEMIEASQDDPEAKPIVLSLGQMH
jgi:hypothetical protein